MLGMTVYPCSDPSRFDGDVQSYEKWILGFEFGNQVDALVEWFSLNFQDPIHSASVDDGRYWFGWGGPSDARDELTNRFGDVVSPNVISKAVSVLERDCIEWDVSERRLGPEPLDETPTITEVVQLVSEVRKDIATLTELVSAAGIGHNHPPDEFKLAVVDFDEIKQTTIDVEKEVQQPVPDVEKIHDWTDRFNGVCYALGIAIMSGGILIKIESVVTNVTDATKLSLIEQIFGNIASLLAVLSVLF